MAPITNEQALEAYAIPLRNERNIAAKFYAAYKGTELEAKYKAEMLKFAQAYNNLMCTA